MFAVWLAILLSQVPLDKPAAVADVRQLTVAQPKVIAEIDTVKVEGDPIGLAWNADGVIYLRVIHGKDAPRHYQIATKPSLSVGQSDGLPAWAATYWNWKSATVAPGDPALKIDVEQHEERKATVNTPSGGALAGMSAAALTGDSGGEGMSTSIAMAAANNSVVNGIVTLRFKGQVVGEWTNEVPRLGMRIGWAPAPMGVLAYTDAEGHLWLIDRGGHKTTVPGVNKALLPAWSLDGKQLLFLQKKGRTEYQLTVVKLG
jgi:hypothetical protein